MMFGLKMAPTTFQRIIMEIFGENIPGFMQVSVDNFAVYSRQTEHLDHLWLSLNPGKSVFGVASGHLLGHIISKDKIVVDPDKVRAILEAPKANNVKALSRFMAKSGGTAG